MAFFNKLKAVFGFGESETDEELNEKFLPYEAQHRTPYINPFKKEENSPKMEKEESEVKEDIKVPSSEIDELPAEMYNGVLSIINSTIPTFVRECLDVEAEKRAIANTLGPHIRNAMQKLRRQIEHDAHQQWEKQREEMAAAVELAENRCREASGRVEQATAKAQSADAQRKVVAERCRTLENRVAELEAEREQFDLENKSLVNKLKVAQVHADDIAHYREEAEDLRKQLAELKKNATATVDEAKWNDEISRLQQEIVAKDADIDALNKKIEDTELQLADARKELDDAISTLEIANEVQEQVDRLSEQIKARDMKIASMRAQWDKKEAEAARNYNEVNNANLDLKLKYDLLKGEAQKLREAVSNADKDKEAAVAEYQELLIKSEKTSADLQRRVEELKREVGDMQKQAATIAAARDERTEDMKKQLEAAATLIEQRDSTIKQLSDKIGTLEGEMSYTRVSESESRLKIKHLIAELEEERLRSKQLSEQLATNTSSQPETINQQERLAEQPIEEIGKESLIHDVTESADDDDNVKPEPELEEAVREIFKINVNDADDNEPSLPIDTTVEPPLEPVKSGVAIEFADELNDEGNIDNTFASSGNDIPELDDDIEWLMPSSAVTQENENVVANENNEYIDIMKEEPRQQQMSLF